MPIPQRSDEPDSGIIQRIFELHGRSIYHHSYNDGRKVALAWCGKLWNSHTMYEEARDATSTAFLATFGYFIKKYPTSPKDILIAEGHWKQVKNSFPEGVQKYLGKVQKNFHNRIHTELGRIIGRRKSESLASERSISEQEDAEDDISFFTDEDDNNPETIIVSEIWMAQLMDSLPTDQYDAWVLYYKYGMTVEEIGRYLGVHHSTITRRIQAAREYMQHCIRIDYG